MITDEDLEALRLWQHPENIKDRLKAGVEGARLMMQWYYASPQLHFS